MATPFPLHKRFYSELPSDDLVAAANPGFSVLECCMGQQLPILEIVVGLAVVVLIAAVRPLRRTVLSLLGLFAIIGAGSAVFAAVIWGIYQAKPWMKIELPAAMQEAPESGKESAELNATAEADLTAALAAEDAQRLEDEKQRLEDEKLRISILAARARVVLEEDRKLAAQATSYPLPPGVGEMLGDLMAIRIPAWRDKQVAAVQKESIRAWLHSIGLAPEETASIVTAKAWGSLYDLWVAENPGVVPPTPESEEDVAATTAESESTAEEELPGESDQTAEPEAAPEPPTFVRQAPPPRARFRTEPRQIENPPRSSPNRRTQPEPEVGPFGF